MAAHLAPSARGMAERADMRPTLGAIACPTLVIVGGDDVISPPEEMVEICRAIPHGRYVEIAGAGHMSPTEVPDAVNDAILEFLATI